MIPPFEHMLTAFLDCGPVRHDGAGQRPIEWRDALAYATCTDAISEPWEFRVMCRMSLAYLQELQGGTDPLRIPPTVRGGCATNCTLL